MCVTVQANRRQLGQSRYASGDMGQHVHPGAVHGRANVSMNLEIQLSSIDQLDDDDDWTLVAHNNTAITNHTPAVVLAYPRDITAQVVLPNKLWYGLDSTVFDSTVCDYYNQFASRLGVTWSPSGPNLDPLSPNVGLWPSVTQRQAGCVVPCTANVDQPISLFRQETGDHCGSCVLLSTGTATVAAVPASGPVLRAYGFMGVAATALCKLLAYVDAASTAEQPPWCSVQLSASPKLVLHLAPQRSVAEQPAEHYISVLVEGVTGAGLYAPLVPGARIIGPVSEWAMFDAIMRSSIVQNCPF